MPIDSLCSGCGKTLRVNDEFVGRKARCPLCGFIYVVGDASVDQPKIASNPTVAETTYVPQPEPIVPTLQPLDDSWSSLATEKPAEKSSGTSEPTSTAHVPNQLPSPVVKFFVRTPNSMEYGPSDAVTILDWISQGRLDDSCHVREETSSQWIGIAAWRFQSRKMQNPMASPVNQAANSFGSVPVSTVQSAGYSKSGNGTVVLILGILSWVLCPTFFGAMLCSILAIVFASIEFGKIRNGQSPEKEKIRVYIGLWLGIANLVAWVLMIGGVIVVSFVSP